MSKQREALEKALEALESDNPDIMLRASIAIREALAEPEQKPLRRGDRLKCMESGEYCIVWATSRSGKTMIQWADRRFGGYTEEQIGEHFWIVPEIEQEPVAWLSQGGDVSRSKKHFDEMGFVDSIPLYTSPAGFTPLTEQQILELLPDAQHGWTTETYGKWVARAIERAHGITE